MSTMMPEPSNNQDLGEMSVPGPCYICGRSPAAGYASEWTRAGGERWFCHGDDDGLSCYEKRNFDGVMLDFTTYLLRQGGDQ